MNKDLKSIMVNSDKSKEKYLYIIDVETLIDLIIFVSHGNIMSSRYQLRDGRFELVESIYKSKLELFQIGQ